MNKSESEGTFADVARYKWEQAKDDLETAEILLEAGKYKAANNRAYYSCYHAIDAVLAMEPIAFKKHKELENYDYEDLDEDFDDCCGCDECSDEADEADKAEDAEKSEEKAEEPAEDEAATEDADVEVQLDAIEEPVEDVDKE